MIINETKLNDLLGQMVNDMGAAVGGALIIIGDRLGLYKELAAAGPLTAAQLATRTTTAERYVYEWLAAQAASNYVEYDDTSECFYMTPEQAAVFADVDSPVLMTGGFYSVASVYADEPQVTEAFQTGGGVHWGDHHSCLFCGVEKFFRPGYQANLISQWLPALEGVTEKLTRGATIADVGCGHGVSTILMAQAFPHSHFHGFDIHPGSIQRATELAQQAEVTNVSFEVATAKSFSGSGYDLVTFFDCLHDMGDPVGAATHARKSLDADGTLMIVEPFAHDNLTENLNPVGRVYYAFSATVCVPTSLSQEVGFALGAQAGEARLQAVATSGGFTRFRRATETPFNLILEAKP
ncbi:class I SAM-dependent methyltransferase [Chloroflexi bacterium TSY]|nr:class I SAM-dependent methyltransferase [Chloroflexi bacterium TSY]